MSYGIHPIAVSLSQLQLALQAQPEPTGMFGRLFGTGRKDLVTEVLRDQGPLDEDDGFDDEITVEQALRELCSGSELSSSEGAPYAYALFALCNQLGEFQANAEWSSMRSRRAECVDEAIEKAGVPAETLRVQDHLMYRGAPVDIPEPFDFPFMGYLKNAELAPALKALSNTDQSTIPEEFRAAVAQIVGWLKRAQALKIDLVCFYF